MNEFELIGQLIKSLPSNAATIVGAGDDCAVIDLGVPGAYVLFKTDAVVEGIHFQHDTPPDKVGHKAIARCLSDIAAMAGKPTSALITIGLPKAFDAGRVKGFYSGMARAAERYELAIVGGETTTNPERVFISVSMLGTVEKNKCLLRSGAKSGDAIFVTGTLGGSLSGGHLDFEPRLAEARWLADNFPVHSMIDISDGLAGDLRHILDASRVGAELLAQSIPISRAARLQSRAESSTKPPLLAALTDGEDFELLFTLPSRQAVPLVDAWKSQFPELKLSCVGKITHAPGLKLRDKDSIQELTATGYVHFG